MDSEREKLVSVKGVHKKFCRQLKYNMYYGVKDLTSHVFGITPDYSKLRKDEFWALEDVNFDIYENEIIGLLGTNGSGKTTLIRMLAGIYDIERGEIDYHQKLNRVISVFALKAGLYPVLTGRENIYLKSAYFGLSRKEVDQNLDFIVSLSGLSEALETPLGKYSSGMKTKLAMSIALSIQSDILYVDEGFSFSDEVFKVKCFNYLKEQYQEKGKAFILATHRIGKIKDLVNRIILLEKGEVLMNTKDIDEGIDVYLSLCEQKN